MPPQSAVTLGRLKARLEAERQGDGSYNLVLSLKPLMPDSGALRAALRQRWTLLEGLESLHFEYFDPQDGQPKTYWEDSAVVPALVELHGAYKDHTKRPFWIAVRPRSIVPAECSLDWASLTCRTS
jgi:hypothetical protein